MGTHPRLPTRLPYEQDTAVGLHPQAHGRVLPAQRSHLDHFRPIRRPAPPKQPHRHLKPQFRQHPRARPQAVDHQPRLLARRLLRPVPELHERSGRDNVLRRPRILRRLVELLYRALLLDLLE